MVNETDGQVELCVIVIQPADQNIGDITFDLTVETQDGTAGMSNQMNAGQFTKVITVGSRKIKAGFSDYKADLFKTGSQTFHPSFGILSG